MGTNAGGANETGASNVCIGHTAGDGITSGSYNICIGQNADASAVDGANQIIIGDLNQTGKGNSTGFIAPSTGGVYQGNNSSSWSTTSDRRLKKNIEDNTIGLDAIKQIRIRNFEYRKPDEVDPELVPKDAIKKEGVQVGIIAQEIAEILPDVVKQESTGVYSVDSDHLTWYLINAVKDLSAEIEELKQWKKENTE